MSVRGAADGFEGLCIAGWAIADPDDHSCQIEVRDPAGKLVASGRASRARPDLAGLGFGRSTFAFRLPLGAIAAATTLTVTADGQELFGSPLAAGPGLFDGFADVSNGYIDGWVTERCADARPPLIEVVDATGAVLAAARARIDRSGTDPFFTPARYFIAIPTVCAGRGDTQLRIHANGVPVGQPVTVRLDVQGALDHADPLRCTGWLGSREAPGRRFELEVFRDGRKVGEGIANIGPETPPHAVPHDRSVAFDIALDPLEPHETGPHLLSLRLAGAPQDLFGGPFIVSNRAALVETARALAQHQHDTQDPAARAVLQAAMADFIARARHGALTPLRVGTTAPADGPRLTILIPIYRDPDITRACIDSVLAIRDAAADALLLINDASPDPAMPALLAGYAALPKITVLTNPENLGFVRTVNRGFGEIRGGDVLLLNSDTRLFPGAIAELRARAHATPGIGTVTALSNNASVFSYPAPNAGAEALDDASWEELAAIAMARHQSEAIEVPTGHGFCMLITRPMLDRVGLFDVGFGRGYGEENDFCQRGADLGFRHIAAAGVLVEHREGTSFGPGRLALLKANLARLAAIYPDYNDTILAFLHRDPLSRVRWTLHRHRIARARAAAGRAILVVGNYLGGGTARAERDITTTVGYGGALHLRLACLEDGTITLEIDSLHISERFAASDAEAVFAILDDCAIDLVLIHHVLGFEAATISGLAAFARQRRAIAYAHDFLPICPRVTLLDATGQFCGGPEPARCTRCIGMAGAHEASRTPDLSADAHRALFADLLGATELVIAPSADTVARMQPMLPEVKFTALGHPHLGPAFPATARPGTPTDIALLGAIGPHKGSAELLALATRARLTHPDLHFHVIGYTNIDDDLEDLGNVTITGKYTDTDLPGLIADSGASLALFLPIWPETFSYTLSEAVAHGLIPVVPNLGAPAERVRDSGFGVVFPYPFDAATVLDTLDGIATGRIPTTTKDATPRAFATPDAAERIAAALAGAPAAVKRKKK